MPKATAKASVAVAKLDTAAEEFKSAYLQFGTKVQAMRSTPAPAQSDIKDLTADAASLKPHIRTLNRSVRNYIRHLKTTRRWNRALDRAVKKAVQSSPASDDAKSHYLRYVSKAGGVRSLLKTAPLILNKLSASLDNTVKRLAEAKGVVVERKISGDFFYCFVLALEIATVGREALTTGDAAHLADLLAEFKEHCIPDIEPRPCPNLPLCIPTETWA
jgi:hypothetical protein